MLLANVGTDPETILGGAVKYRFHGQVSTHIEMPHYSSGLDAIEPGLSEMGFANSNWNFIIH